MTVIMFQVPGFRDSTLLQQALTHRSYLNEHPDAGEHNERLEFLGDAVLNFLSGEFLFKRYPDQPEGKLTPLRSALVDETQLAKFAIALGLDEPNMMRLGRGADLEGGRRNANLLSCAFEAIIGAYFLDTDSIDQVRQFVTPLFASVVETLVISTPTINFKSRFQEWALKHLRQNPKYQIIKQTGPDHARQFTAEVWVGDRPYGSGTGRRKQDAEKAAAADALSKLGLVDSDQHYPVGT
jgi:ribonuclease III